ncbi:MAG: polymerase sigma-54 factor [Planctomycetota bacterium]|jgi:RNA polymerase sigma-54 factor
MSLRFDASQQLRTGQHLRLAPKLIQSMEILQLPLPALEERIERELESNVALELAEPAPPETEDGAIRDSAPGLAGDETAEQFERLRDFERRYGELWNGERSSRAGSRFAGERDPKMAAMANAPSRGESLESQLTRQWSLVDADPDLAAAGERILEFVDEDGLLHTSLEQILDQSRSRPGVAWSMELLERALERLQRELEPAGVAARDLRESLRLQIEAQVREAAREAGHGDGDGVEATAWSDALELVEHHYDDLLQNRLPKIAQQSRLSMERINEARERLRKLSIAPGRELVESRDGPVYPDVIVEYDPTEDRYVAALQEGSLPSLRISPHYRKMAKDRSLDVETRRFVASGVRSAGWLIDSINQRSNTLLRVVEKVIERQREFLDHGPHFLKPMPMIDVAAELGLHVGTVSRAVSEKWIQTPRGIFPLRKLFSGGQESSDGEDRSWEAIKAELKEVVDAEDRTKPLSDRAIAEALEARGIRIARRTVVKYREQMGIPSARQRREHR